MACHHCHWARLDDIGHGIPSFPLDNIHGKTTLGITCYHHPWKSHTIRRRWGWPLGVHKQTTSGVACHHFPWTAHMVERHLSWHDIIALFGALHSIIAVGQNKRSDVVECGITYPIGSKHSQTTSTWHAVIALRHHT